MATRRQKIFVIITIFITIVTIGAFIGLITQKPIPSGPSSFLSNIAEATLPQSLVTVDSTGNLSASIVVSELIKTLIPTGSIMPFCGDTAPSGFLICDGSVISPTTYPELSILLGSKFGTANQLPDLRGRVVAGAESTGEFSGIGTKLGTISKDVPLPSHYHYIPTSLSQTEGKHGLQYLSSFSTKNICASDGCTNSYIDSINVSNATINLDTDTRGTANATLNVVQPTLVLNYIIKT